MTTIHIQRKSDDELLHYGIKGQKWGVRRFENPDGTLTEAGKARIAKTAGSGYLNPSYKDQQKGKAQERKKVAEQYQKEYWKHIENEMPKNSPSEEGRKLWNKYKDTYASATLKDLKMKDTHQARQEVKNILSQIDADYRYIDKPWTDNFSDRQKTAATRREELAHPERIRKDQEKFAKLLTKSNSQKETLRSDIARSKLQKSEQMKKLASDKKLVAKYGAAKKAKDAWYKLSKGEDFDGFKPDKNGYDAEYGITKKQYDRIASLDKKRRRLRDEYSAAVSEKSKKYIKDYNSGVPASKAIQMSSKQRYNAEYWLSRQLMDAIASGN